MTKAGLWLCHSMQFAAMLTVLSNLVQCYVYLGVVQNQGTFTERHGPTLCVSIATLLLMVHPTVFLLRDLQLIHPVCQSTWGLFMLYCCTWFGYINLFYGAMWSTRGFEALRSSFQQSTVDEYSKQV
jgi:hypothetical protein